MAGWFLMRVTFDHLYLVPARCRGETNEGITFVGPVSSVYHWVGWFALSCATIIINSLSIIHQSHLS
jgi:hypothetical protein